MNESESASESAANRAVNRALQRVGATRPVWVAWLALQWRAGVLALAVLVTLGAPGPAQAQANRPVQEQGSGPEPKHANRHGHGHGSGPGHAADPERWPVGPGMMLFSGPPEQINRVVDRLLDGLSASDAQRTRIKQIALAAATDVQAQRATEGSLRDQAVRVFAAPTLDPAAAEALRQQMLAQQDQTSKRTLAALLDAARVLTPEQRAKVAALMQQRQVAMQERRERLQRENSERVKP